MPVNLSLLPDEVIARGVTVPQTDLFGSFFGGQEQYQKQQLQNLFSGGLPKTPEGDFDYPKIADMLARASGAQSVPLLAALRQGDIQQQALRGLQQGGGGVFDLPSQAPAPPSIQRTLPPQRTSEAEIPATGERLRKDQPGNIGGDILDVTVDGQPTAPAFAPTAVTAGPFSSEPDTGPPTGRFTQVAQAPRLPTPPPAPAASPIPPGQPGYFTEENAARHEAIANRANFVAQSLGIGNLKAEGVLQQGKQAAERAKQIRDYLSERAKASGYTGQGVPEFTRGQEDIKHDVEQFRKQYTAIQDAGINATTNLPKVEAAKNLTLSPNFTSGPWNEQALLYQQFKSLFGRDVTAATPIEAFNKFSQDLLQEQIKSLAGSGVGRVLQSEVNIMRQAIATTGITAASNRALLEMIKRTYAKQAELADLTQNMPANSAQLNQAVLGYLKTHPTFTPQEIRNPILLGAPDAPPQSARWNDQQKRAWATSVGLSPGDPVRFGGQVYTVPP